MWPFRGSSSVQVDSIDNEAVKLDQQHLASVTELETNDDSEQVVEFGITGWHNERLSIPFVLRAPLLAFASFTGGFMLGGANAGPKAAYRFRAENAHRLPTTANGWFLYHKSKNYHSILGGVKEGLRYGTVVTGWASLFLVTEEVIDRSRGRIFAKGEDEYASGQRDAASTVMAGMSVAGLYSWRNGLDKFAAGRIVRTALKGTLAYGLVQDAVSVLRGDPPAYLRYISRKVFGTNTELAKSEVTRSQLPLKP